MIYAAGERGGCLKTPFDFLFPYGPTLRLLNLAREINPLHERPIKTVGVPAKINQSEKFLVSIADTMRSGLTAFVTYLALTRPENSGFQSLVFPAIIYLAGSYLTHRAIRQKIES